MAENKTYTFKTIDIRGRSYVTVSERIKYFVETHPGWVIYTEIIERTPEEVLMKAVVRDEEGNFKAEGLAHEMRNSSMVNKTSYIENCQTSAIGRALGFLGIGISDSIASAEEVSNAISKQEAINKEPELLLEEIRKQLKNIVDREFAKKAETYISKNNNAKLLRQVLGKIEEKIKGEIENV